MMEPYSKSTTYIIHEKTPKVINNDDRFSLIDYFHVNYFEGKKIRYKIKKNYYYLHHVKNDLKFLSIDMKAVDK